MSLRDTLPAGTVIGEFEIRHVLGQGGFGIVYEAYEPMLDRRVALKEYFLQGFSRREALEVHPADEDSVEMFGSGMTRFIREARLLSMLNERTRADGSLVAVYRVFQANRTAFMAMKLYEGQTLRQTVLGAPEKVSEAWLVSLLQRMLDALHALHSLPGENLVHRDVSPDNIILQPDGRPVLLDFGATRKASDAQTSLIYKPGYSPIEQYTDAIKQGPWTDLYALNGVAYFAIARQSPMPAVDRYAGAAFVTAAEKGTDRFSPEFLALVDKGMSIMPEHRFQSADEMRAALAQLPSVPAARSGAWPSPTQARAAPTATFVAPPATTPLTHADQGVAPDEDTTQVDNSTPTKTWAPGPTQATAAAAALPATPTAIGAAVPPAPPAPALPFFARRNARLAAGGLAGAALAAAIIALVPWGPPDEPGGGGLTGTDPAASAAQAASAAPPPASVATAAIASTVAASAGPISASASVPTGTANPAHVPGLACPAADADWPCVLDGLARLSTAPGGVALRVRPATVKLGERITVDVTSRNDGVLQILAVDEAPGAGLILAFPNALDGNNRVRAGRPLQLPRPASTWHIEARPPLGRSWMIAVVTSEPIKLPATLSQGLTLQDAVRAFAEGRPGRLLGVPDCTAGGPPTGTACPKTLSIQPADFIIR
ncbi:serine/threonine-protein kinase [Aquabacterium sp.]|uniref:serine/threonine-protein kinase n=1 Tax=Aquabacterium sp. TaxID=1872578 RepID=UPI002BEF5660|nr:serine/threonine-protein kinase [Aquabacterium sp.]HSW07601.1 serine/threonine-protein kinase [Aquabacterium sp.]